MWDLVVATTKRWFVNSVPAFPEIILVQNNIKQQSLIIVILGMYKEVKIPNTRTSWWHGFLSTLETYKTKHHSKRNILKTKYTGQKVESVIFSVYFKSCLTNWSIYHWFNFFFWNWHICRVFNISFGIMFLFVLYFFLKILKTTPFNSCPPKDNDAWFSGNSTIPGLFFICRSTELYYILLINAVNV